MPGAGYGEELTSSVRYLDIDFGVGTAAQHETNAVDIAFGRNRQEISFAEACRSGEFHVVRL